MLYEVITLVCIIGQKPALNIIVKGRAEKPGIVPCDGNIGGCRGDGRNPVFLVNLPGAYGAITVMVADNGKRLVVINNLVGFISCKTWLVMVIISIIQYQLSAVDAALAVYTIYIV